MKNFIRSAFFLVQFSYPDMTTGEITALTIWTFVNKVMSLLFNSLSRFIIAFPPRNKSFNFMAVVTICSDFWAQKNKVCHYFSIVSSSIYPEGMRLEAMILVLWMLNLSPVFSLLFHLYHWLFSSTLLSAISVLSSAYLRLFSRQSSFQLELHPAQNFAWCTLHIS